MIGGLGLFLFGMSTMSDGLRKVVTESDLLPEMVSDGDVYFASLAACGDVVAFVAESYPGDRHELYMYRYSDDSLTIMLRRGDVLDGWIVQDIELDRVSHSAIFGPPAFT